MYAETARPRQIEPRGRGNSRGPGRERSEGRSRSCGRGAEILRPRGSATLLVRGEGRTGHRRLSRALEEVEELDALEVARRAHALARADRARPRVRRRHARARAPRTPSDRRAPHGYRSGSVRSATRDAMRDAPHAARRHRRGRAESARERELRGTRPALDARQAAGFDSRPCSRRALAAPPGAGAAGAPRASESAGRVDLRGVHRTQ